ncbi:TetR/AcrR family transcriptional regulator [Mycetocola spongiae]|uniref:TetR/AcrR family transcriptional regulator n=1 Tax=Mycetocola spongiae TaxID=2859226 RepID=UPI001CF32C4F|nr:TetR/AcrR family transcriptional regulator [Mycetocola spongiae]UCR88748.1 TetR/AcrR family transcriptional regulator [Mycetocola spongiae]
MTGQTGERKRGRPTASEREERREIILDAAVALFLDEGYGHVSVDAIAERSGVTKRTLYIYFGDKSEIFAAAVGRLHDRVIREAEDRAERLPELSRRIVRTLHSAEAVALHRLVIAESGRFPDLAAAFYRAGPERYRALLAERLIATAGSGIAREALAEALFSLLLGEAHRRRLLGILGPITDSEVARHADAALRVLGLGEGRP